MDKEHLLRRHDEERWIEIYIILFPDDSEKTSIISYFQLTCYIIDYAEGITNKIIEKVRSEVEGIISGHLPEVIHKIVENTLERTREFHKSLWAGWWYYITRSEPGNFNPGGRLWTQFCQPSGAGGRSYDT